MSEETTEQAKKFVAVIHAQHEWTAPDNPSLNRWKLVIEEVADELSWAYTYNPALAKPGYHEVTFYRDTSMRRCIRVPKKKEGADESI